MYYNTTANNNSTVQKPSVPIQTCYFFPFCPRLSPRSHSCYSTAVLAQPTLAGMPSATQELLLHHYQCGHKLLVPEHFPAAQISSERNLNKLPINLPTYHYSNKSIFFLEDSLKHSSSEKDTLGILTQNFLLKH